MTGIRALPTAGEEGFTLIEVLVALLIASVVIANVMNLFSTSLQFSRRIEEQKTDWGALEAAANQVLSYPEDALLETLELDYIEDHPPIRVAAEEVEDVETGSLRLKGARLYQVTLSLEDGDSLELSVLVPERAVELGPGQRLERTGNENLLFQPTGGGSIDDSKDSVDPEDEDRSREEQLDDAYRD